MISDIHAHKMTLNIMNRQTKKLCEWIFKKKWCEPPNLELHIKKIIQFWIPALPYSVLERWDLIKNKCSRISKESYRSSLDREDKNKTTKSKAFVRLGKWYGCPCHCSPVKSATYTVVEKKKKHILPNLK